MTHISFDSEFGAITLFADDGALVALEWGRAQPPHGDDPLLSRAVDQLLEYFAGKRETFDLALNPMGTAFQQRVWRRMAQIPFGSTISYGEVAAELATSARAIGGASANNPLPILIPCHRVLGSGGGLGGYSGGNGIETKQALLRLEGVIPADH